MLNTLPVQNGLQAATEVSKQLPIETSDKAVTLYRALVAVGLEYASAKGFSSTITVVSFHSSVELLAEACGFSRVTAWKYLKELKALNVCDYRTHKASCRGVTRNSGTVFMIRLKNFGAKCKLSFQDLKHKWVDMDKAVRNKTTSYAALNIQRSLESLALKFQVFLDYSLNPKTSINPVKPCMLSTGIEALLAVPGLQGKEIARGIDTASQILAKALQDAKSVNVYRKILWGLKRRTALHGDTEFYTLHTQVSRIVRGDMAEVGSLKRPGALLLSRLSKYPFWSEVMT